MPKRKQASIKQLGNWTLAAGRFMGKRIAMVPGQYLAWLLTTDAESMASDRFMVAKYLAARQNASRSRRHRPKNSPKSNGRADKLVPGTQGRKPAKGQQRTTERP